MTRIRRVLAASVAAFVCAAPAAAQIAPSKPYLMAFHGCDGSACSSPANHRVYLAESNDGSSRVIGLASGSTSDWVDPSMFVDEQGRLVMFLLHAPFVPGGSDPARCPSGVTTCIKQFPSATEVSGSNGTQFTVDPGDRASITVTTSGSRSSASDPDIFFDGTQYVLYISHGSSTSVWTSSTLKGTWRTHRSIRSRVHANRVDRGARLERQRERGVLRR